MGKSIAFLNMKGGVGKTTVAVNLAYYLAYKKSKRILIIDLDPQYNATQYLVNLNTNADFVSGEKPTVYNILFSNDITYNSILNGVKTIKNKNLELKDFIRKIPRTNKVTLDLIPSTIHLINNSFEQGIENKLHSFITKYKEAYDYILVDCPPTYSIFLSSGITACDYYIIPVKPDPLSVLGIPLMEEVIRIVTDTNGTEIEALGVLFTMVRKTNLMRDIMRGVRTTQTGKKYIFQNRTRNSTVYSESSEKHKPLWRTPNAVSGDHDKDFLAITEEFLMLLEDE